METHKLHVSMVLGEHVTHCVNTFHNNLFPFPGVKRPPVWLPMSFEKKRVDISNEDPKLGSETKLLLF